MEFLITKVSTGWDSFRHLTLIMKKTQLAFLQGEGNMKTTSIVAAYMSMCGSVYSKVSTLVHKHASLCLFIAGIFLLSFGLSGIAVAAWDDYVLDAVKNIFALIEGSFGALIMVVAGLGAIIAAAMGAYRGAMGCLVIAVGAFILRSIVTLFFGEDVLSGTAADPTYNRD